RGCSKGSRYPPRPDMARPPDAADDHALCAPGFGRSRYLRADPRARRSHEDGLTAGFTPPAPDCIRRRRCRLPTRIRWNDKLRRASFGFQAGFVCSRSISIPGGARMGNKHCGKLAETGRETMACALFFVGSASTVEIQNIVARTEKSLAISVHAA